MVENDIEIFLREWNNDEDCIFVNTSGSTGRPKEVSLPKKLVEQSAFATNKFFNIDSDSFIFSCISSNYIGGKLPIVRALLAKCDFGAEIPSNYPKLVPYNSISNHQTKEISLLSVVPSQLPYLIENKDSLPKVRNYLIGGSAIPRVIQKHISESGIVAWESYGMTETASHIGLRRVVSPARDNYFIPMEDVSVELDDRSCLVIRREGWDPVVTNDIAEISESGNFKILGRIDNVINSGGRKFHPEEAEKICSDLIPYPFYFKGIPNDKWGEEIQIVIAVSSDIKHLDLSEIRDILSGRLDRWQLPKSMEVVTELPMTFNGKILRR